MKTVTAKSASGKYKMRVPIAAEDGPFCVAHPVDLRENRRRVFGKLWSVYHTKSGAAFAPAFKRKSQAVRAMNMIAEIKGRWNRPYRLLIKDHTLGAKFFAVLAQIKVECGDWIRIA